MVWERVRPADVAALLGEFDAPWWIAGGWALDLFLGTQTREHGDVDVAVLRRDQLALHRHLRGWDLRYATPERKLEPWTGQLLSLPVHAVWARRSPDAPWTFEVLLNEHEGDRWVYRRNPAVSRPLDELGGQRDGIPFLRPEVVLLYASKEQDERGLDAVLPRLSDPARSWLREALTPGHPWLGRL